MGSAVWNRLFILTTFLLYSFEVSAQTSTPSSLNSTCNIIQQRISSASSVYYPGSSQYDFDIEHFAPSSTQPSACSVEPGTADDVGIIMQILGTTNTEFAVKGGGHTFNPTFSSTEGVQISMVRFNQVSVNEAAGTVTIGTGLIWDEVYSALDPLNLTIVGGRVTGVGVAGFILGGGYSYKTNEYGIALANVLEVELVLPNGTVTTASSTVNPDLLFGVKGTQNNFGIVTTITVNALPQGLVWGGYNLYPVNETTIPAIVRAASNFANNVTDPNAAAVFIFNYGNGSATLTTFIYYNGVTPAPGVFDELLSIPTLISDVYTRNYTSLVQSSPANATLGWRASLSSVMALEFNEGIISDIINSVNYWGNQIAQIDPLAQVSYPVEPFLSNMFAHGNPGAWPPNGTSSVALKPIGMQWSWLDPTADEQLLNYQTTARDQLITIFANHGQNISHLPLYPNYARYDTSLVGLYGERNLKRLEQLKSMYDPNNVMGLTGGWRIPG